MVDTERAQRRKANKTKALTNARINIAISAMLRSENGKDFFWWLLQIGKVGTVPFSPDAMSMAFANGELNVGNQILARVLETDPEGYINLLKEKHSDRSSPDTDADNDGDLATAEPGDIDPSASGNPDG